MNRVPMTVQGEQALREELERLKKVDRPRITQAIAEAREHGDLKENAEYHAARATELCRRPDSGARAQTVPRSGHRRHDHPRYWQGRLWRDGNADQCR